MLLLGWSPEFLCWKLSPVWQGWGWWLRGGCSEVWGHVPPHNELMSAMLPQLDFCSRVQVVKSEAAPCPLSRAVVCPSSFYYIMTQRESLTSSCLHALGLPSLQSCDPNEFVFSEMIHPRYSVISTKKKMN